MFSVKYNVLALIQVAVGLFNFVLFINIFGVTKSADAYLLAIAMFSTLQLLQLMSCEQVLYFYNDAKAKSTEAGHHFYHSALFIGLMTGAISILAFHIFFEGILWLFLSGQAEVDIVLLEQVLKIVSVELVLYPFIYVNQKVLNAESYFSAPYLLNIIPILFVSFGSIYLVTVELFDVKVLAYARIAGTTISFLLAFVVINKVAGISIKFRINSGYTASFLRNSFSIRAGHNLHNFLFMPITTNVLSAFSTGTLSYFFYSYRIVMMVVVVLIGPSTTVFQSRMASNWSKKFFEKTEGLVKKYLYVTFSLMLVATLFSYFLIPFALHLVADGSVLQHVSQIQMMFVGLALWKLIVIVESCVVAILVANKNSLIFIMGNLLFAILYYLVSNSLAPLFGMYSIVFGLIFSQLVSLMIYFIFAKKVMDEKCKIRQLTEYGKESKYK